MAKFLYRMQNILDIKYKLEESAKQEYADARMRLNEEEKKLSMLKQRKNSYYEEYLEALNGKLDYLKIDECSNALNVMDMMIEQQNISVRKRSRELEQARIKLNHEMQERKMHEKLKEKQFESFLAELSATENKETDEVVSYRFNGQSDSMEG